MRRLIVVLLLLFCVSFIVGAKTSKRYKLRQVVKSKVRMSKNVLLVIDTSGSMGGSSIQKAMSVVQMISQQATDEMSLAIIAFDGKTNRWTYQKSVWTKLPDNHALRHAKHWLDEQGTGGTTKVIPALRRALRDKRHPLSIVLISDGAFYYEFDTNILKTLRKGQKKRRKSATLHTVSVAYVGTHSLMARLGKIGGGGCWEVK